MKCPKCSSETPQFNGRQKMYSQDVEFDFYYCEDCNTEFVENPEVDGPKESRKIPTRDELLKKIRWEHEIADTRDEQIAEIVNGRQTLLPSVYKEFREAVSSDQTSAKDYQLILEESPTLTERVMDLINGPLLKLDEPVDSFQNALTLIETDDLVDLTLAVEIISVIPHNEKAPFSHDDFWKHGIACGLAAQRLGNLKGETSSSRLFLAGLLHDLGRLILACEKPELVTDLQKQGKSDKQSSCELEEDILGFSHAQIGAHLLRKWNLPEKLVRAIEFHHHPMKARPQHQKFACILHIANAMTYSLRMGAPHESVVPPLSNDAIKHLEISRKQIQSLLESLQTDIMQIFTILV